jgi:hypothetical protein
MPWLHRRVGNPLLTGLLNMRAGTRVSDAHSGLRAFRRGLLPHLALRSGGMELASEHLVRSGELGLVIRELPIHYRPRRGRSNLFWPRDGWRHLRLLLRRSASEPVQREPQPVLDRDARPEADLPLGGGDVGL